MTYGRWVRLAKAGVLFVSRNSLACDRSTFGRVMSGVPRSPMKCHLRWTSSRTTFVSFRVVCRRDGHQSLKRGQLWVSYVILPTVSLSHPPLRAPTNGHMQTVCTFRTLHSKVRAWDFDRQPPEHSSLVAPDARTSSARTATSWRELVIANVMMSCVQLLRQELIVGASGRCWVRIVNAVDLRCFEQRFGAQGYPQMHMDPPLTPVVGSVDVRSAPHSGFTMQLNSSARAGDTFCILESDDVAGQSPSRGKRGVEWNLNLRVEASFTTSNQMEGYPDRHEGPISPRAEGIVART